MAYASIERITSQLVPEEDLVMLLDDERLGPENPAIAARIETVLAAVDDELDTMLRGLYELPFASTPELLGRIADARAAWSLYNRRATEKPENIRDAYQWSETRMRMILRREIQLASDTSVPAREPAPSVSKTDDDRIFPQSMLDTMPR